MYPHSTRIAVQWYSDGGRRAIAHAVAYDPISKLAFDAAGTQDVHSALDAYDDQYSMDREMEASATELADHMQIQWDMEEPFAEDGVAEAAGWFEGHFLRPQNEAQWQQELDNQISYGAPDPRNDPTGYAQWFAAEAFARNHDYLSRRPALGPLQETSPVASSQDHHRPEH